VGSTGERLTRPFPIFAHHQGGYTEAVVRGSRGRARGYSGVVTHHHIPRPFARVGSTVALELASPPFSAAGKIFSASGHVRSASGITLPHRYAPMRYEYETIDERTIVSGRLPTPRNLLESFRCCFGTSCHCSSRFDRDRLGYWWLTLVTSVGPFLHRPRFRSRAGLLHSTP
jgi:hypothetical protein